MMQAMLSNGILGQHEVIRIRQPEGDWYRGDWVIDPEKVEEELIKCSVQELSRVSIGRRGSNKLHKELEGDRATVMIKLYAPPGTFQEADDEIRQPADNIEWRGRLYEISAVNHWISAQALSHDEVYAKRIDHDINRHSSGG